MAPCFNHTVSATKPIRLIVGSLQDTAETPAAVYSSIVSILPSWFYFSCSTLLFSKLCSGENWEHIYELNGCYRPTACNCFNTVYSLCSFLWRLALRQWFEQFDTIESTLWTPCRTLTADIMERAIWYVCCSPRGCCCCTVHLAARNTAAAENWPHSSCRVYAVIDTPMI